jgi:flagellar protein FlaH
MNHYPLGLTSADRIEQSFGGGLPTRSICLLQGDHSAGKSVLIQRLLCGMTDEGVQTALVSTTLNAREFVEQMNSLSYDIVDDLLSDRLLFFSADGQSAPEDGRTPVQRLFTPSPLWDAEVVFIDSIEELLLRDPEFVAAAERGAGDEFLRTVVSGLRAHIREGTTVVLAVNHRRLPDGCLHPLRDAASVYLDIQLNKVGQEVRRQAVVRRFAGPKVPIDDTISFKIAEGRGLMIESKAVV